MAANRAVPPTWHFYDARGILEADLGDGWRAFNETLTDCVSTRRPKGHPPPDLSTYWIDETLKDIARDAPIGTVYANANATTLTRSEGGICASSQYDEFEPQEMPIDEFVAGLLAWREATAELLNQQAT